MRLKKLTSTTKYSSKFRFPSITDPVFIPLKSLIKQNTRLDRL